MTNTNVQYKAPKWVISMWETYKYFIRGHNSENAYGVFHAGRMAIESAFNATFEESTGFFDSGIKPIESESFGIAVAKPQWTHAVFNGECSVENLTSGRLYPIYNVKSHGGGFKLLDDKENERYCLTKDCAHLGGGNWTLVSM
jgi:hypothetical protein